MGLGVQTGCSRSALAALRGHPRAGERWWIWGTVAAMALAGVRRADRAGLDRAADQHLQAGERPGCQGRRSSRWRTPTTCRSTTSTSSTPRSQTKRVSANVSGILGTAAVAPQRQPAAPSLPEIRAVMGHELGHYVMNHIYKDPVLRAGDPGRLPFAEWGYGARCCAAAARLGPAGHRRRGRLAAHRGVSRRFSSSTTPINNTMMRTQEIEADMLRPEPRARAARRGRGRPEAHRIPQARPGPDRGIRVLRPPERAQPHPHGDAVEGGKRAMKEEEGAIC